MLHAAPTTRFTVRGNRLEVHGRLDAGAAVGFWAVVQAMVGDEHVTIDLSGCESLDDAGRGALERAERQLRRAGTGVMVLAPTAA
jgi:anti-anti-sigma regulatory factor